MNRDVLPIDVFLPEIVAKADLNDVLIISGDTGCGKSTRVPQALLETKHFLKNKKIVAATQPRRVAAIKISERISQELNDSEAVGYAIGNERRFNSDVGKILMCTCGWLVTKLVHTENWASENVSFILIDEAHEREVDMDLLCMLCNKLLQHSKGEIKIVLMSATLDANAFDTYFHGSTGKVEIHMRRFPVDIHYADTLPSNLISDENVREKISSLVTSAQKQPDLSRTENTLIVAAATLVDALQKSLQSSKTVLVFCSGFSAIEDLYCALESQPRSKQRYEILTLHSSIEQETQLSVFEENFETESLVLRVVLATNMAESSVTIPNVGYVIDTGMHKVLRYEEVDEMNELTRMWISKASAKQRAGRTGRVCKGTVVRLYSESKYGMFRAHNEPEIQLIALEQTILRLFALKRVSKMEALQRPLLVLQQLSDPPDKQSVMDAHRNLLEFGALKTDHQYDFSEGNCYQEKGGNDAYYSSVGITSLGEILTRIPLSFRCAKFVLFGAQFHNLATHFAVMGAYMSAQSVFVLPYHKDSQQSRYLHQMAETTAGRQYYTSIHHSDLMVGIEIFKDCLSLKRNSREYKQWLRENGLHGKRVDRFRQSAITIISRMAQAGFSSAQKSLQEITQRSSCNAVPYGRLNQILPTNRVWAQKCLLVIALACRQNLILCENPFNSFCSETSSDEEINANVGIFDTIHFQMTIENFEAWQPRSRALRTVEKFCRFLFETHLFNCQTVSCQNVEKFGSHTTCLVTVKPKDVALACHQLRQMMYKGCVSFQTSLDALEQKYRYEDRDNRISIKFSNFEMPLLYRWVHKSRFCEISDYPPRSPLHNLPVRKQDKAAPRFAGKDVENLFAVAPIVSKSGRRLQASMISAIPPRFNKLYGMLSEYRSESTQLYSKFSRCEQEYQQHNNEMCDDKEPQQKLFNVYVDRIPIAVDASIDRIREIKKHFDNCAPLIEMMRNWTTKDLIDQQRMQRMNLLLTNLIQHENK